MYHKLQCMWCGDDDDEKLGFSKQNEISFNIEYEGSRIKQGTLGTSR